MVLTASTIGPEQASHFRADNLVAAAEALNKALEAEGANVRVKVDASFDTSTWDEYRQRFILAAQAGNAPDIILSGHEDTAPWSEAGFIAPLDNWIQKYEAQTSLKDIFPTLWNAVTYKGRRLAVEPPACQVIEYAIEWDADIGHLYALEHVWVYLDKEGMVVRVEASWHGAYREMVADGRIPMEDGHPILYVEPGKHAMAPSPLWFRERSSQTLRECTRLAGAGGIWLNPLYGFPAMKSPQTDRLARTYLRRKAFTPTWIFDRRLEISPELLRPTRELLLEIPRRLQILIERLEREIPEEERDLLIIAHRGASTKAPENTLDAIRQAAMDDADAVELDVRVTADGIPVLHHDAGIRWPDGTLRPLEDVFLSELRVARPEIPTLAEALEVCQEAGLGIYLDLKVPEAAEPAALIVRQTGMVPFVFFGAREPAILRAVQRALPWAYRAIMFTDLEADPVALAEAADAHYVHPCWEGRSPRPEEQLTPAWVKRVHAYGLGVISWHEERPAALRALKAAGVDGVMTDRPDLAVQTLHRKEDR